MSNPEHIVLFDGVCNLCNESVSFIIKHDSKKLFKFASLQSEYAKNILTQYDKNFSGMHSIIYIEKGKIYDESNAALRISRHLDSFWRFAYLFIIVPKFLRDGVYKIIAKNRYKWFGKKESCMMPSKELKSRFLDA